MKFTVSLEDIEKFGPNVACARSYILKRVHATGGRARVTTREMAAEMSMGAYVIRAAVRSLIEEEVLRFRKEGVPGGGTRGLYEVKGHWGWPTC